MGSCAMGMAATEQERMGAGYSQWVSRIRVPAGFLFAAIYLIAAEPRPRRLILGCVLALAGLALRASSAGVLEKNRRLAVTGPYAHTRNPLYLGSAIAALGFSIAAGVWWLFLLLAIFFAAVYVPVMRSEEARLHGLFPAEYAAYARAVPLLVPRLTPWTPRDRSAAPFSWQRYWSNHEYRAAAAFALITAALAAKLWWMGGN